MRIIDEFEVSIRRPSRFYFLYIKGDKQKIIFLKKILDNSNTKNIINTLKEFNFHKIMINSEELTIVLDGNFIKVIYFIEFTYLRFNKDVDFLATILTSGKLIADNLINCIKNSHSINMCRYKAKDTNISNKTKIICYEEAI